MNYIKIRINGYLKNINDNNKTIINTFGIKQKKIISFMNDNIKHKIILADDLITLIRENEEFVNIIRFAKNKELLSEYTLKENNFTIDLSIKTLDVKISDNFILIKYVVIESDETYEYKIELLFSKLGELIISTISDISIFG